MNAMNEDPPKPKFPREAALTVAESLRDLFYPMCSRICVAGSLRRRKTMVGDIEILYIPRLELRKDPQDMFATINASLVDEIIERLEATGVLARRLNCKGSEMFGQENKLMRSVATAIPVDLFRTTEESWFNYLVCRTDPAESNVRIAQAAREKGWKWHPYGTGFSKGREEFRVTCEKDVFDFVNLPFLEPWERK